MSIFEHIGNLFFVNTCTSCANELVQQEKVVCASCMASIAITTFNDGTTVNPIKNIFKGRVQVEQATAFYYYSKNSIIQKLLFELKYNNRKEVAKWLGTQAAFTLLKNAWIEEIDAIIPIPLAPKKEFQRGYNQSLLIAEAMQEILQKNILTQVVYRKKYTETQTKKTRTDRIENVQDAFEVKNVQSIENKHVLLIDDVLTTGATFESCIREIKLVSPTTKISLASLCYAID